MGQSRIKRAWDAIFSKSSTPSLLNTNTSIPLINFIGGFIPKWYNRNDLAYIKDGYESSIEVYSIINKIARKAGNIPWVVEQRTSEGWEEVTGTTLHDLMEKPNKKQTFRDVNEEYCGYLLANGNAFMHGIQAETYGPTIWEICVLPSLYMEAECSTDRMEPVRRWYLNWWYKQYFTPEQIMHTRYWNPGATTQENSLFGLSPLKVGMMAYRTANDRWTASAHMLQNRGVGGILTTKTGKSMSPEEHDRIMSQITKRYGGPEKANGLGVTNKDLSYIQLGMPATDLQIVQQSNIPLRALCNIYSVDSSLFNDPDNKTYNNRREATKGLYTEAIMPLLDKVAESYNRWLVPTHYPDGNYRMKPDYSQVEALQSDKKEEVERLSKLVETGAMTPQQMAEELGIPFEGTESEIYKMLNSLDADVAKAIIGAMTQEEIRSIIGLTGEGPAPAQPNNLNQPAEPEE